MTTATIPAALTWQQIPFYRRPFFLILTILIFWPLSWALLWSGPSYRIKKGQPYTRGVAEKLCVSIAAPVASFFLWSKVLSYLGGSVSTGTAWDLPSCDSRRSLLKNAGI